MESYCSREDSWVKRNGVKPNPCTGTEQNMASAHSHQIQQAFRNLFWWWDRSLLKKWLCAAAFSHSASPHPLYSPTHPNNGFFVAVEECSMGSCTSQLCLCLELWWITVGSLKSLQLSDRYQTWGQLAYAPFNTNYMHSWILYHLVNATPNCQGLRAPESTETNGRWGFSFSWMQFFFF